MKFAEMQLNKKKGIKLESSPPIEGSAWQHSLRVYLQMTYWKITRYINPTDYNFRQ